MIRRAFLFIIGVGCLIVHKQVVEDERRDHYRRVVQDEHSDGTQKRSIFVDCAGHIIVPTRHQVSGACPSSHLAIPPASGLWPGTLTLVPPNGSRFRVELEG